MHNLCSYPWLWWLSQVVKKKDGRAVARGADFVLSLTRRGSGLPCRFDVARLGGFGETSTDLADLRRHLVEFRELFLDGVGTGAQFIELLLEIAVPAVYAPFDLADSTLFVLIVEFFQTIEKIAHEGEHTCFLVFQALCARLEAGLIGLDLEQLNRRSLDLSQLVLDLLSS